MTQIERKVTLLAHTQLSEGYVMSLFDGGEAEKAYFDNVYSDAQALALTAIRTCYSPGKPSEIVAKEGARYFGNKASDGGKGSDADRLIRMIQSSGHTSTLEGITFNFAVEGVSRALLAQLTRHRIGTGFSVQSQRYVKFGSDDRSGGFDYVVPDTLSLESPAFKTYDEAKRVAEHNRLVEANEKFADIMERIQSAYDELRALGIPAEDARAVLPNAAACNLVLTFNLRALLDFYGKRKAGRGGQKEITDLAEDLKNAVVAVEPWTSQLFEATI